MAGVVPHNHQYVPCVVIYGMVSYVCWYVVTLSSGVVNWGETQSKKTPNGMHLFRVYFEEEGGGGDAVKCGSDGQCSGQ